MHVCAVTLLQARNNQLESNNNFLSNIVVVVCEELSMYASLFVALLLLIFDSNTTCY